VRALQATILILLLAACVDNPAGVGVLTVAVEGDVDTTWVGAPGEPMPRAIRLHVTDAEGRALSGASLQWEAIGRNALVLTPAAQTDRAGLATAGWQLGTDAAEQQQLRVTVRSHASESQVVIRARAVPHVVEQVRIVLDTPAVVRLGDTLAVGVVAVDPYGNEFSPPDAVLFVGDTSLASPLADRVVGRRRGRTFIRATSQGLSAGLPLVVKQYVAAIVPLADTLRFSALGAQRPVTYQVRDDRGRIVADTMVAISVADGAVAQLDGEYVRALALGFTTLRLALGPASASIVVGVQQRVGSLALIRDTIRLDALLDTTTIVPLAHDSLGSPIANPSLAFDVSDRTVARFATTRTLEALKPGAAVVTVRDSTTSVSTSAPVVVRQVITSIDLPTSEVTFDALGDTLTVAAVARDRLGSVVQGAALQYSVVDTSVAAVESGSLIRSLAPGQTVVVATDPETGIVGTAVLKVEQRAATLRLTDRVVSFDALGDTVPVAVSAWDRLGAPIANASATYTSTDPAVVAVTAGGLVSSDNGSALLIARSADGPVDTAQVTVAQRVTAMVVGRDTLTFESLRAVQGAQVSPVDRRGAAVRNATLAYTVEDTTVATVDAAGQVVAVANGATRLLVVADDDTAAISVNIAQRPVRVAADTIRFDALGDARTVTAVAFDSLGSAVPGGVSGVLSSDTAVVDATDSVTVRARGNGVTTASVTVAGIAGDVVVVVDQVATALNVNVTYGNAIVTLPAGSPLPLSCVASDRNGYAIAREVGLVRAVKGTVAGSGCADATIQRSGYDTLVFGMGAVEARVPVIVATRPDSVGVLAAALPLPTDPRIRFVGEDLANPSILALRPLVADILADYGNPTSSLDRARAIRDWVARTAIYPDSWVRPDTTTSNLSVLPLGKTWQDANQVMRTPGRWDLDATYWRQFYADGYLVLNKLLGTLDQATGQRANDGMMEHVAGSRYRIRDIESYHYLACSFQAFIVNTLWAAAGLHGMIVSVVSHDPTAVFIPEMGRWVYEDASYNNEYLLDGVGEPLSPLQLLAVSTAGQSGRLRAVKTRGPDFDPAVYPSTRAYTDNGMHPEGMIIVGPGLYRRWVGYAGFPMHYVAVDVPALSTVIDPWGDPNVFTPVSAEVAFPMLAPTIDSVAVEDSVQVVHLGSTFPGHVRYERRIGGGAWETVGDTDVLPIGASRVEYRSVDSVGSVSASAVLDVWAPRTEAFVQAAPLGSLRAQARYYVSP
jgi:hypothetical protein